MDAVNVVLILMYAFVFFAEEEKKELSSCVQYSNELMPSANDFHDRYNITMESSLYCGTIHVNTNISVPSIDGAILTTGMNSSSGFHNVTSDTHNTIFNQFGPYNFDQIVATNISQERSYRIPPRPFYLEIPKLDVNFATKAYPGFPTLTITSPMDLDRDILRPYFNIPMNLHHGASVRADIVYMFILVTLAIELMAGLAVMVKHFHRVNCTIQKDMDELRNKTIRTLQDMKEMRESFKAQVRQNRILLNKLEDEKEGKVHFEQASKALRCEFMNYQDKFTERLEAMEGKIRSSKKVMDDTLKKQAIGIENVIEGMNYRKDLTEMSTQTKVYPKRSGILVKERRNKRTQKKVDFWV